MFTRCVLTSDEPVEIIVMDDLGVDAYKMANRFKGLDMDHAKLTLVKLAKFHAASAVYFDQVKLSII